MESKHLIFKEIEYPARTKRFEVISKFDGTVLGIIKWHNHWRQYWCEMNGDGGWTWDCMIDGGMFIKGLMEERKKQRVGDVNGQVTRSGDRGRKPL
jgi:hypothetical protein